MRKVDINAKVTAEITWNSIETTILKQIYGRDEYPQSTTYSYHDMVTLNGDLGTALDPDDERITVPERFFDRDQTGTRYNSVQQLFDRTETVIANMATLQVPFEEFRYDPTAEV
jgi:hypothetical protein